MSENFVPNDLFMDRLEWQLASEYRRKQLLGPIRPKIVLPRRVAVTLLVVGLFMSGVTAIKAAEYFKDSWRKKIEIARVETDVRLKEVLRESARQSADRVARLYSLGLIETGEDRVAELSVKKAGLAVDRSLLNRDEVKASGTSPRDEIYAPKVGGRDFVGERLTIGKKEAELEMAAAEIRRRRTQDRAALGLISAEEMQALETEAAVQKAAILRIEKRLDLRKRFLAGDLTAQAAEIDDRLTGAEEDLSAAAAKVDVLRERMKRQESLMAVGMASVGETQALKTALDAALDAQKLALLEIDVLKKSK
jgi:hypothetical protein